MKRSEALEIIENNGPMGIVDRHSEKILKALENAGMVPTTTYTESNYRWNMSLNDGHGGEEIIEIPKVVYSWEQE